MRPTPPCTRGNRSASGSPAPRGAGRGGAGGEPGLVQDELNAHVGPLGLLFGPDTSTSNRATLGGMIGNNSGGAHSIAYGLTVEHGIELTALLADGTRVVFGEATPAGL